MYVCMYVCMYACMYMVYLPLATGTGTYYTIHLLLKDCYPSKPFEFHVLCQNVHTRMPILV